MMSISHLLEDFALQPANGAVENSELLLEEERLEAFEKGYQAGWDDSNKARDQSTNQIASDILQALQTIKASKDEAFATMLEGLNPLLTQIVQMVLPRLAQDTLAPRLTEIISELVAQHGVGPIEIAIPTGRQAALDALELPFEEMELVITEDASLGAQDVRIALSGHIEREIDLTATIDQIADVIGTYFTTEITEEQRITA